MIKVFERYLVDVGAATVECLKQIKLTGRWKIKIVDNEYFLFVEKKGLIFNSWLPDFLVELQDEKTYINGCDYAIS